MADEEKDYMNMFGAPEKVAAKEVEHDDEELIEDYKEWERVNARRATATIPLAPIPWTRPKPKGFESRVEEAVGPPEPRGELVGPPEPTTFEDKVVSAVAKKEEDTQGDPSAGPTQGNVADKAMSAKKSVSDILDDKHYKQAWDVIEAEKNKHIEASRRAQSIKHRKAAMVKILKDLINAGALLVAANKGVQGDLKLGDNTPEYDAELRRIDDNMKTEIGLIQAKYNRATQLYKGQQDRKLREADIKDERKYRSGEKEKDREYRSTQDEQKTRQEHEQNRRKNEVIRSNNSAALTDATTNTRTEFAKALENKNYSHMKILLEGGGMTPEDAEKWINADGKLPFGYWKGPSDDVASETPVEKALDNYAKNTTKLKPLLPEGTETPAPAPPSRPMIRLQNYREGKMPAERRAKYIKEMKRRGFSEKLLPEDR